MAGSKKVLAIFGATGQQGGALAAYVLSDPELSASYAVRAITRDVTSSKVANLRHQGAEVVPGDISDVVSLESALKGVQTVFIMTTHAWGPNAVEVEFGQVKNAADTAVALGVEYVIFSTLPHTSQISGGKYAKAEEYIRSLPVKSAFYSPGSFMENFHNHRFLLSRTAPDGTVILSRHTSPTAKHPLIAVTSDTGKFIGAILADPDKYVGKTLCAAVELHSWDEIVETYSKVTGRKTVYEQVPVEEYRRVLPEIVADGFIEVFSYVDEFGYYGPDTKELVEWAGSQARGKLTTLEEYLNQHPESLA